MYTQRQSSRLPLDIFPLAEKLYTKNTKHEHTPCWVTHGILISRLGYMWT